MDEPVITVREPDIHHNHWGVVLLLPTSNNPFEFDCDEICRQVEKAAQRQNWNPFHQGGHHLWGERCTGRHFFEFFGLDGDTNYRSLVENFIEGILFFRMMDPFLKKGWALS